MNTTIYTVILFCSCLPCVAAGHTTGEGEGRGSEGGSVGIAVTGITRVVI